MAKAVKMAESQSTMPDLKREHRLREERKRCQGVALELARAIRLMIENLVLTFDVERPIYNGRPVELTAADIEHFKIIDGQRIPYGSTEE